MNHEPHIRAIEVAASDPDIPILRVIKGGGIVLSSKDARICIKNYAITNDFMVGGTSIIRTVYFRIEDQTEETKRMLIAVHAAAQMTECGVDLFHSMQIDHETGCCKIYINPPKSGFIEGIVLCARLGHIHPCQTPVIRFQAKPCPLAPPPLKDPPSLELNAFLFSHRRVGLTMYNVTCLEGGAFAVPVNKMGTLAMLTEASYSRPTGSQWERAFPYLINPFRRLSFTFNPSMTVFDWDALQDWEELIASLQQLLDEFGGPDSKIYVSTRPSLRTTYHAYCTFEINPDVLKALEAGELEGYEGWNSDTAIRRGAGRAVLSVPLLSEKIGKGSHEFVACITGSGVQPIDRSENRQQHHAALTEVLSHVVDPSFVPTHVDTPKQTVSKQVDKAILDCIAHACNHTNFRVDEVSKSNGGARVNITVSKGCWKRNEHKTNRCVYRFWIDAGHFSAKCYSDKCGGSNDLDLPPNVPRSYLQDVLEREYK